MKITDWVATKLGYMKAVDVGKLISSVYTASPFGIPQEKSYAQLVDAYKSWVYTCVDKIAKAVAMIPLKLYVYRKGGTKVTSQSFKYLLKSVPQEKQTIFLKTVGVEREEITDHPFLTLIHHPNGFMTRFMLWYETMVRLELGGMCGWLLLRDGLRVPKEIWPLPLTKNALLQPKISSKLILDYWDYEDGEVMQRFKPEEILLMKYPHPASPFQWMSPLMAQTYPYDIDLFLMQQQRALFENMAVTGLNLTTEQKMTRDQVKEMKEIIDEQYAGAIRAGKTMVLHSGLKADKLGMTTREAMIDQVANFARDKLITSFDLSPGKVGLVEDVNRANMEALNETFIQECLRPKCMLIEEVLETFLLPIYDEGLTCDFELPDYGDKEFRLKERQGNLSSLYTSINEERQREGRDPVPWGYKPWVPFTLTQTGEEKPISPVGKSLKLMDRDFWTQDRKDIAWKLFVKRSDKYEQLFLAPLKTHFKEVAHGVISRLDRDGRKILGQYSGWSKQKVEQHIKSNKGVEAININKTEEGKKLIQTFTPIVMLIMKEIGNARIRDLSESIKTTFEFNINDPRTLEWIGKRMREFSDQVSGTTFDDIESILKAGFSEGLPLPTIAQTLSDKFSSWDKYRAPLIARTETISAMNQADIESVRQMNLEDQLLKHWLTAGDERVRETHQAAGEEYADGIPMDEDFVVGGDSMEAPGGGSDPGENINCRCTLYYTEIGKE